MPTKFKAYKQMRGCQCLHNGSYNLEQVSPCQESRQLDQREGALRMRWLTFDGRKKNQKRKQRVPHYQPLKKGKQLPW
eukprot:1137179-Pelagomonas_calceolata.AAC.3